MARPGESTTSPRRLLAKQRQAKALAMKLAGAEYVDIADKLGFASRSGAFAAVEAALKADMRANVSEELSLNLRRLNRLLLAAWPKAVSGDPPMMAEARAILAERAKLLGLYPAPGSRRQEHIDEDLLRQEVQRAAADLGLSEDEVMAEAMGILYHK